MSEAKSDIDEEKSREPLEGQALLTHLTVQAEILNVSKGGISVECGEKLKIGNVYTVRLFWCGAVYDAKCQALWTLGDGSGKRFRSGMRFVQIDKDKLDDFVACIEERVTEASKRLHPRMKTTGAKALLSHP